MSGGLVCPDCGRVSASRVVSSKPSRDSVKRRRECSECGGRWTTFEVWDDRLALLEGAGESIVIHK